jgi:hypothetical protein
MPVCQGYKHGSAKDGRQLYQQCQVAEGTDQDAGQFLSLPRNGQKTALKEA